jgi:hypothetical protein
LGINIWIIEKNRQHWAKYTDEDLTKQKHNTENWNNKTTSKLTTTTKTKQCPWSGEPGCSQRVNSSFFPYELSAMLLIVQSSNSLVGESSNSLVGEFSNSLVGESSNSLVGESSNSLVGESSNSLVGDWVKTNICKRKRLKVTCDLKEKN